jgi:hypothetical protein
VFAEIPGFLLRFLSFCRSFQTASKDSCGPDHQLYACAVNQRITRGFIWVKRRISSGGMPVGIRFKVNGGPVSVDAPQDTPLLWVLREQLKLTGTKFPGTKFPGTKFTGTKFLAPNSAVAWVCAAPAEVDHS